MSGVYIKGLKMPPKDGVVNLRIWGNGVVESTESYHSRVLSGVTAVPVPEHGRLIDGDVLFDFILNIHKTAQGDARKAYRDVLDTIVAAGDVIPAEEGEG